MNRRLLLATLSLAALSACGALLGIDDVPADLSSDAGPDAPNGNPDVASTDGSQNEAGTDAAEAGQCAAEDASCGPGAMAGGQCCSHACILPEAGATCGPAGTYAVKVNGVDTPVVGSTYGLYVSGSSTYADLVLALDAAATTFIEIRIYGKYDGCNDDAADKVNAIFYKAGAGNSPEIATGADCGLRITGVHSGVSGPITGTFDGMIKGTTLSVQFNQFYPEE